MNDKWVTNQAEWITKELALSTGIADTPADGSDISTLRGGYMDPDWDFNQIQKRMTVLLNTRKCKTKFIICCLKIQTHNKPAFLGTKSSFSNKIPTEVPETPPHPRLQVDEKTER